MESPRTPPSSRPRPPRDGLQLRADAVLLGLPLAIAGGALGVVTVGALAERLVKPFPANPWESATLVDVYRVMHGLPLYGSPASDHSPGMYGFLQPWWIALGTGFTTPTLLGGRLVSLVATVLLLAGLFRYVGARAPLGLRLFWIALGLGFQFTTRQMAADPRPDSVAWLWGAVFLGAWTLVARRGAQGDRGPRARLAVGALAALLLGAFTKQTAAMAAAVPVVVALLGAFTVTDRGRLVRSAGAGGRLLWACLPLATLGGAVLVLRFASPAAYHAMITVPAGYAIVPDYLWVHLWKLTAMTAPGLVAGASALAPREPDDGVAARVEWPLVATLVFIPACAVAAAKVGGDVNSYVPALLASVATGLAAGRRGLAVLEARAAPLGARLAATALFALLVLAVAVQDFQAGWQFGVRAGFGDASRAAVIEAVRGLPGTVVSPNDPAIALDAKGTVGRSMFYERDASHWSTPLPSYCYSDLGAADWVVLVSTAWEDGLDRQRLAAFGFREVVDWPQRTAVYSLWRPARPPMTRPGRRERARP